MISVEIPTMGFMVGEIIIGIIASIIWADFPKILGVLTAIGFAVGLFVFAFSNPTAIEDLNVATNKITFIVVAGVNVILHSLFFDIGAGIIEVIRHPPSRR